MDDDVAYYGKLHEAKQDVSFSIFPAFLKAAVGRGSYANNSHIAGSRSCEAWIALQRVEVGYSLYEFRFFCMKKNGEWSAMTGNADGSEPTALPMRASSSEANRVLQAALSKEGAYEVGTFGAPCYYLTVSDGNSLARFAVLAPGREEIGSTPDRQSAADLVLDAYGLGKRP